MREQDGTLRPRISPAEQAILYVVMVANVLFFSVLGGALLTRYLLPLYPLILLLCVSTFYRRVPYWWGLVLLSAAAFLIGLFVNPPYKFAPEDNLNYADVIRLHQQAIRQIVTRFPGSTVLTAWPATDELTKPELGYLKKPHGGRSRLRISPCLRYRKQRLPHKTSASALPFQLNTTLPACGWIWARAMRPWIPAFSISIAIWSRARSLTFSRAGSSGARSGKGSGPRFCTSTVPRWQSCDALRGWVEYAP